MSAFHNGLALVAIRRIGKNGGYHQWFMLVMNGVELSFPFLRLICFGLVCGIGGFLIGRFL